MVDARVCVYICACVDTTTSLYIYIMVDMETNNIVLFHKCLWLSPSALPSCFISISEFANFCDIIFIWSLNF